MTTEVNRATAVAGATAEPRLYREATARYRAGDYARARALLEICVVERPKHLSSYLGLGDCLVRLGFPDHAERVFRAGLRHDPGNRPLLRELARLLAARKRWADSAAVYERYLAELPGDRGIAEELSVVRRRLTNAADGGEATGAGASGPGPSAGMEVPPATGASLAAVLTKAAEHEDTLEIRTARGKSLYLGRRRLLSHRRLWLAALTPVALIYLALQAERLSKTAGEPLLVGRTQAMLRITYLLMGLVFVLGAIALIGAVLSSHLSRYVVYERRVDACTGVLFRRRRMVWLFETTEVQFEQRPHHLLANSGTLVFYTERAAMTGLKTLRLWSARRPAELNGFGSAAFLRQLHHVLVNQIVQERHAMKRQFI